MQPRLRGHQTSFAIDTQDGSVSRLTNRADSSVPRRAWLQISRLLPSGTYRVCVAYSSSNFDNLTFNQLNKTFKETVDNDTALQYKIELAVNGMEDGPPNALSPADRLQMLRKHSAAWNRMSYTSVQNIHMASAGVWELYGGILAHGISARGLTFTQLPSELRGIKQRSWTLPDLGVKIRDFGMDPTQDLLVLVVKPPRG